MSIHAAVKVKNVADTSTNQNTSNCNASVKVKNVADTSTDQNTSNCKGRNIRGVAGQENLPILRGTF
ncbi:hypothetical protein SUGI_0556460 [Cryptomeria japonica]|nr:hypothetical protein SUGI_0556460 [Cryptomeria japonica]